MVTSCQGLHWPECCRHRKDPISPLLAPSTCSPAPKPLTGLPVHRSHRLSRGLSHSKTWFQQSPPPWQISSALSHPPPQAPSTTLCNHAAVTGEELTAKRQHLCSYSSILSFFSSRLSLESCHGSSIGANLPQSSSWKLRHKCPLRKGKDSAP